MRQLEKGVPITPIFTTNPCQVRLLKTGRENSLLKISISEGKKRQVRRMLAYLGFQVLELKRTHIGILNMNNLETGQYRFLKREEIKKLKDFLANN